MVQHNPESGCKYWVTRSSVCSFAHTGHSFARSAVLALLANSVALIRFLAHSLTPKLVGKIISQISQISQHPVVLNYSATGVKREKGAAEGNNPHCKKSPKNGTTYSE